MLLIREWGVAMRFSLFVLALATLLNSTIAPAIAGGIHVHIDLHHPLAPVSVQVGPVHVNPSPLPIVPPIINVDGNGTIAKIINKTNQIVQAPIVATQFVVTLPLRAYESLRDSFNKAVADATNKIDGFIADVDREIPTVLIWIAAGFFIMLTLAILVAQIFSKLAQQLFDFAISATHRWAKSGRGKH